MKKIAITFVLFVLLASTLYAQNNDNIQKRWDRAIKLLSNKEYEAAIKEFKVLTEKLMPGYTRAACFYNIACAYLQLGNKEQGLLNLAQAIKEGFRDYEHCKKDKDLDSVRNHPLFKYLTKLLKTGDVEEMNRINTQMLKKRYFEGAYVNSCDS